MVCILGILPQDETQHYQLTNFTNHAKLRKYRLDLINTFNILYYFEVYRFKDKSRQVHCLFEDSSVVIFNKVTKKVITVILADSDLLDKYINKVDLDNKRKLLLEKYARLNSKYKINDKELSEEVLLDYLDRKSRIM